MTIPRITAKKGYEYEVYIPETGNIQRMRIIDTEIDEGEYGLHLVEKVAEYPAALSTVYSNLQLES